VRRRRKIVFCDNDNDDDDDDDWMLGVYLYIYIYVCVWCMLMPLLANAMKALQKKSD
jgi:hypothetical protein